MKNTINIAPSWIGIYPLLKEMVMHGNKTQREYVCEELEKLCKMADDINKKNEVTK